MKARKLIKNAIRCKLCGDIIESKYRHNFVTCSCGACSVDGGLDYLRRCGNPNDYEDVSEYQEIDLDAKYKIGEKVSFKYPPSEIHKGIIRVVDIFPCSTIIEYDIWDETKPCLYKHIPESYIIDLLSTTDSK